MTQYELDKEMCKQFPPVQNLEFNMNRIISEFLEATPANNYIIKTPDDWTFSVTIINESDRVNNIKAKIITDYVMGLPGVIVDIKLTPEKNLIEFWFRNENEVICYILTEIFDDEEIFSI